ncbi:MAG: hypothetical protein ACOYK8_05330 [Alphaproteobacteria bacterium]
MSDCLTFNVIKAFSDGEIGWREAANQLGLENYAAVEELLHYYQLPLYQPSLTAKKQQMDRLDLLLYGKSH